METPTILKIAFLGDTQNPENTYSGQVAIELKNILESMPKYLSYSISIALEGFKNHTEVSAAIRDQANVIGAVPGFNNSAGPVGITVGQILNNLQISGLETGSNSSLDINTDLAIALPVNHHFITNIENQHWLDNLENYPHKITLYSHNQAIAQTRQRIQHINDKRILNKLSPIEVLETEKTSDGLEKIAQHILDEEHMVLALGSKNMIIDKPSLAASLKPEQDNEHNTTDIVMVVNQSKINSENVTKLLSDLKYKYEKNAQICRFVVQNLEVNNSPDQLYDLISKLFKIGVDLSFVEATLGSEIGDAKFSLTGNIPFDQRESFKGILTQFGKSQTLKTNITYIPVEPNQNSDLSIFDRLKYLFNKKRGIGGDNLASLDFKPSVSEEDGLYILKAEIDNIRGSLYELLRRLSQLKIDYSYFQAKLDGAAQSSPVLAKFKIDQEVADSLVDILSGK